MLICMNDVVFSKMSSDISQELSTRKNCVKNVRLFLHSSSLKANSTQWFKESKMSMYKSQSCCWVWTLLLVIKKQYWFCLLHNQTKTSHRVIEKKIFPCCSATSVSQHLQSDDVTFTDRLFYWNFTPDTCRSYHKFSHEFLLCLIWLFWNKDHEIEYQF